MRLALKIAYDGRAFYGHQRQPDVRTVEGECLAALRSSKIISDPATAFFRSASRTDRGVSAIGNAIAFNASLGPEAVLGAFNDAAEGVWAWAVARVPDSFHPRHARERWYRYHLYGDLALDPLRQAGAAFVGTHDFRAFTSDPPEGPFTLDAIDVVRDRHATVIDVRARSFRRGMVRRIVAAMLAVAQGDAAVGDVMSALEGRRAGFGNVPAEPLFLMDVLYDLPFEAMVKPKVRAEWRAAAVDADLRNRFAEAVSAAGSLSLL